VPFEKTKRVVFSETNKYLQYLQVFNRLRKKLQIKDNYSKYLMSLDDFTGEHNGIMQLNIIDWLAGE